MYNGSLITRIKVCYPSGVCTYYPVPFDHRKNIGPYIMKQHGFSFIKILSPLDIEPYYEREIKKGYYDTTKAEKYFPEETRTICVQLAKTGP